MTLHAAAADAAAADGLDQSGLRHLIGYLLTLAELGSRRTFERHIGKPHKLRPVEFTILVLLIGNRVVTAKRLAQALRVSPPNLTVLVDRLVDRGLVQRERSPTDGRAMHLRLTEAGAELARRAHRTSLTMESALLAPLSPAERAMLGELLTKLVSAGAGGGVSAPASARDRAVPGRAA